MSDLKQYYATVKQLLQTDGHKDLSAYCMEPYLSDYVVDHDNWDGGIDTYNIDLEVPVTLFNKWNAIAEDHVEKLEELLEKAFNVATRGINSIRISHVVIRPIADADENMAKERKPLVNSLHFEVQTKQGQRSDYIGSVEEPSQYPCFILVFNWDWTDYDYRTWFCLFYFKSHEEKWKIGELKLMCSGHKSTMEALPDSFDEPLPDDFCSLGISNDYYIQLRRHLREEWLIKEVQHYLCDCTFDAYVYEKHRDEDIFKNSLMRDLSSIDAFKEGQSLVMGVEQDDMYSFEYVYHPVVNTDFFAHWKVRMTYSPSLFMRTIGIIGNNGVGKTQILSHFVSDLLAKNHANFRALPHFKCVLVVCSTPFDSYPGEQEITGDVGYKLCCLEQDKTETIEKLKNNIAVIEKRPTVDTKTMSELWRKLSSDYVSSQFVENVMRKVIDEDGRVRIDIVWEALEENVKILSSGQLHILSLVTDICANIHYRSLIIIDEPEVHLHPHITMEFMAMLGNLLTVFKSYAIIATHSPLVVREMAGKNVYLMQKMEDGIPQIAPVVFETLGEDVTMLYHNLFGYDESSSSFKKLVDDMCDKGKSYDYIVRYFERDVKLTLNARLIIRDAIKARDDAQI